MAVFGLVLGVVVQMALSSIAIHIDIDTKVLILSELGMLDCSVLRVVLSWRSSVDGRPQDPHNMHVHGSTMFRGIRAPFAEHESKVWNVVL